MRFVNHNYIAFKEIQSMKILRSRFIHIILSLLFLSISFSQAQLFTNVDVQFKGAGWIKSGMIMQSTDTLTGTKSNNYNKNWLQDAGALLTGIVNLNEYTEASFGLGAVQKHQAQGSITTAKDLKINLNIFTTQSRLTYFPQGKKDFNYKLTFGLFPYKYDNDIKNLGLYLIRGAVYPGLLVSGFESKEMLNNANMLGTHFQAKYGSFTNDFILTSEMDLKPYFDFSAIYVATYKPQKWLELGAGINFYHFLAVRPEITSPSTKNGFDKNQKNQANQIPHPFDYNYTLIDTVRIKNANPNLPDSIGFNYVFPSNQGTKLMARASIDLKELFGLSEGFTKNDLRVYSEVGLLGIKNYGNAYGKTLERMPIMFGLNVPTGKIFDVFAVELEYYGSKLVPDYRKLQDLGSPVPQTPWVNRDVPDGISRYETKPYDVNADNIKYSIYFARVFAGHVKIAGQVADDHTRTGGTSGGANFVSYEEALTTLNDWYWTLKLSYFF